MADQDENILRSRSPQSKMLSPEHLTVGKYLATRISTLRPPMNRAPSPIKLLRLLNQQQWLFFLVAFLAWSWDAFDFFTVSLTVDELADQFDKAPSQITWGITLVLSISTLTLPIGKFLADHVYSVPLGRINHFWYAVDWLWDVALN